MKYTVRPMHMETVLLYMSVSAVLAAFHSKVGGRKSTESNEATESASTRWQGKNPMFGFSQATRPI